MHDKHIDQEVRRWERAFARASQEHIRVIQLPGRSAWIATSSQPGDFYELTVQGNLVTGCTCPAGERGDPVCKHKAAALILFGVELRERDRDAV